MPPLLMSLGPDGTFQITGLRPHRHPQPHGPDASGPLERHETPDPVLARWNPGSSAVGRAFSRGDSPDPGRSAGSGPGCIRGRMLAARLAWAAREGITGG